MRSPISIKDLLKPAVKRAGIEKEVTMAQLLEAGNEAVAKLLPPGHQLDARVISLREGVLMVACRHASASFAVSRGANHVLDAVKRAAPRADVRRLVARVEAEITRPSGVIE